MPAVMVKITIILSENWKISKKKYLVYYLIPRKYSTFWRSILCYLYSPVDLTDNVNMIEKLVLGGAGTGDLPILSPMRQPLRPSRHVYSSYYWTLEISSQHVKIDHFLPWNALKCVVLLARAPPQTPLWELTALSLAVGKREERRSRRREKQPRIVIYLCYLGARPIYGGAKRGSNLSNPRGPG